MKTTYKIINDSITYTNKDTVITVPLKWYEKEPSKPVQIGLISAWITGLFLVLFIIKHPQ